MYIDVAVSVDVIVEVQALSICRPVRLNSRVCHQADGYELKTRKTSCWEDIETKPQRFPRVLHHLLDSRPDLTAIPPTA